MDWKFQIGDHVVTQAIMLESKAMAETEHKLAWLTPLRINERVSVECIAGTQHFYKVEVNDRLMIHAEDALLPVEHYFKQQAALFAKSVDAKKVV